MKEKYQKLVKNLRFYHDNLTHLEREYRNRYLLIWEQMVVGNYHTYEEAVAEADFKFEPGSFLLKHCKPTASVPGVAVAQGVFRPAANM